MLLKLVVRMLKTPLENPASSANAANASTDNGVSGDGLMTMVQPAARAAPALRAIMLSDVSRIPLGKIEVTHATGKFQGTSAATTPMGCLIVMTFLLGVEESKTVPWILSASPANHQAAL